MIESISHAGHRRRITSAQLAAQSASSLCGGAENGINFPGVDDIKLSVSLVGGRHAVTPF